MRLRKDIFAVKLANKVRKSRKQLPAHICLKLAAWIDAVANQGLSQVRKIPGYHDEPLKGKRFGQRSIRLSKAYRAIYVIDAEGEVEFVEIIEVNKHDY